MKQPLVPHPVVVCKQLKTWLLNQYVALAALLTVQSQLALANNLPKPFTPDGVEEGDGNVIGWLKGIIKDGADAAIFLIGLLLTIGPVLVIMSKLFQVSRGKAEFGDVVGAIFISVIVFVFGFFLLNEATSILDSGE